MKGVFFLTSGTSIQLWKERGWLEGGSGTKTYNAWANVFDTMYFISYGNEKDLQYSDYFKNNIVILPKTLNLPSWLYSLFIPIIYRNELKKSDIYITAQMEGAWSAAIAKYLYDKKFILRCGYQWAISDFGKSIKGRTLKRIAHALEWFTYRAADEIIATSLFAQEHIIHTYKIAPDKVHMIRNAVDTSLFKPRDIKKIPRSILYVGRLAEEKNPLLLLRAAKGLSVHISFFGSGGLEESLKTYAKKHAIHAVFYGDVPTDELARAFNRHEVLVMPSKYENSPKALLEAMASGMAVVGNNVQGIQEIITHKENGYLFENSLSDLKNVLRELLVNKNEQKRIGNNAREYILKHCSLASVIEQNIQLFKKALAR